MSQTNHLGHFYWYLSATGDGDAATDQTSTFYSICSFSEGFTLFYSTQFSNSEVKGLKLKYMLNHLLV